MITNISIDKGASPQRSRLRILSADLRTKILDFRGFDSSIILGGIPRPIGDFPESLSQRILAGRLGVLVGFRV